MEEFSPLFLYRKGPNRFLTITKKDGSENSQPTRPLSPSQNSLCLIRSLLQRFPTGNKERNEMQPNDNCGVFVAAEPGECQYLYTVYVVMIIVVQS